MKITIEIGEKEIAKAAKELVVNELATKIFDQCYTGNSMRRACYDAIKEVIYEPQTKKEIIERAVSQAAHEIRRKAMPLIAEKLS